MKAGSKVDEVFEGGRSQGFGCSPMKVVRELGMVGVFTASEKNPSFQQFVEGAQPVED